MNPAWSMIFFTTLSGAGQGLMLVLFGWEVASSVGLVRTPSAQFYAVGAGWVLLLCGAGLVAATFHLGHPLRAWRAASQWRTSWLSREVIVLPAFMAVVLAWGVAHGLGGPPLWAHGTVALAALAAVLACVLFVCTGMIYAAVKVMREWATPLTPVNFFLLGSASGLTLASALAAVMAPHASTTVAALAVVVTLLAAVTRGASTWRNLTLVPKTTLQTAIGVRHPQIRQSSQGQMGGSFNTREFFHGATGAAVRRLRWIVALMVFVLPVLLLAFNAGATLGVVVLALIFQYIGLLGERWLFFAEGRHPQNLYYQRIG
jgi:sulfite dehydrogenase (quinone) subunit SoeC